MQVTLKNIDIINIMQSISELTKLDLPVKTSWNITKNIKKMDSAFKTFAECEQKIIQKYAIKDTSGEVKIDENNQYKIVPKFISKFNEERSELLDCDNEIDVLMINISDLYDDENSKKIKPATLFNLYFMINDEE